MSQEPSLGPEHMRGAAFAVAPTHWNGAEAALAGLRVWEPAMWAATQAREQTAWVPSGDGSGRTKNVTHDDTVAAIVKTWSAVFAG